VGISLAVSFNTLAGISSWPDDLCGFRASNCFLTPFTPMSSVCIEGNCDGPFDGMGSCSLVKTDLKWLFSVLALS